MNLFFYGTLCHLPLLELVLEGETYKARAASLGGHRVNWVKDQPFPMISTASADEIARGLLVEELSETAVARLNFYEGGFDYSLRDITVQPEGGAPVAAQVYFPDPGLWSAGAPWSLSDWAEAQAEMTLEAAAEVMAAFGHVSPQEIAARFPMIRTRAASRVRARRDLSPTNLRVDYGSGDIKITSETQPYTRFFAMKEQDLSFRRYDGSMSETVNRAAFMGGDAVILLPYDPVRDRVMLIEQFRMGPHMRHDPRPWLLEPIAGRIDGMEAPETCAEREAAEEAGLSFDRLIALPGHYPSPGASSEYFYTYIALCDLPDGAGGIGGLESEAEDIRSHVISFDHMMKLASSGEPNCGPLLLCAYWLMAHRADLRAAS